MPTFTIRNNAPFVRYIKDTWGYFLRNNKPGCKITIRKNDAFIHISQLYCVIFNELSYLYKNYPHLLEMDKSAEKILKEYISI